MLRLLTFGGLALERADGSPPPRLRPQRLALLAVLAAAGDRGVSRDRMAALLWPDADEERARHALRQAFYALRRELGADVVESDAVLSLDRQALRVDVADFRAALASGDRVRAAGLVTGPFLHGFSLPSAPEFERWVEEERASLTAQATRVILALARETDAAGDHEAAGDWWRRLTVLDPLSGRFALGYLKALAARGDRAGALAFARAHESVVRRELEADADPEIQRLEAELRALPSPVGAASTPPKAKRRRKRSAVDLASSDASAPPSLPVVVPAPTRTRRRVIATAAVFVGVAAVAGIMTASLRGRGLRIGSEPLRPTLAVGMIREDGVPDTLRIGGVLIDMLATNLARVRGLSVLANTRLFELMRPGQDTMPTGYSEAARRAGATEILQGRLLAGPEWSLGIELQRVDLETGIVKGAYRVAAENRYALVDSMTAVIARDLRLRSPAGSISEATTESAIAYRLYEEGLRAAYQYDEAAALRLMQAALEEDSTFAMAAYYAAIIGMTLNPDALQRRARALRLASRAPERERLTIMAHLLTENQEPSALAIAESLATRYPTDPMAFEVLSKSLWMHGDWREAVVAIERAIAIDSASEPVERQSCRLCDDLGHLSNVYFWWDSLPAAERTARRFLRLRPKHHYPWHILLSSAAARGDTTALRTYLRRFHETNPFETTPSYLLRRSLLAEDYDQMERNLSHALQSPRRPEASEARWLAAIALRNQGRLEEARRIARVPDDPDNLVVGVIAYEQSDWRTALPIFWRAARSDRSNLPGGMRARITTFEYTKVGMGLAAAGDTAALRSVADTVEYWGQRSLYGRDRRAHRYLRGLLLAAQGQDAAAAEAFREAIHSPSFGFTRINYELGQTLLRLDRPGEAVPVLRSALHGDVDGSNLYVTRTELHELLAQAFDRLGSRDSAAVHYRAVATAWRRADRGFHARRAVAAAWLTAHGERAGSAPRAE